MAFVITFGGCFNGGKSLRHAGHTKGWRNINGNTAANIAGAIFLTLADGAVITSITPNHGLNNQVYGSLAGGTLITLKVKKRVLSK